jgi:hypothetical protein
MHEQMPDPATPPSILRVHRDLLKRVGHSTASSAARLSHDGLG